jgi:hopanoid C-3 methylase
MTPLPGTVLNAYTEREISNSRPELYDMIHALLPTALPLEEFYRELANLWASEVPFYRIFPTLARFGLRGMLHRIRLFGTVLEKIRSAHLDH